MQHNVNRGLATTPASTEIRLAFINDITVSHPVRTHPLQLVLADVLDTGIQPVKYTCRDLFSMGSNGWP